MSMIHYLVSKEFATKTYEFQQYFYINYNISISTIQWGLNDDKPAMI